MRLTKKALTELFRKAQVEGLVEAGDPAVLAARYIAVLCEDLLIRLLMRLREARLWRRRTEAPLQQTGSNSALAR
jgi:hypothetical protein